jgi:hypothetical protein
MKVSHRDEKKGNERWKGEENGTHWEIFRFNLNKGKCCGWSIERADRDCMFEKWEFHLSELREIIWRRDAKEKKEKSGRGVETNFRILRQ